MGETRANGRAGPPAQAGENNSRSAKALRPLSSRRGTALMARISLTDITKSFGHTEVIRDVSLDIEDGELVVFVGPSGCGKSTLLRLISGLDRPTSGTIAIDGRDVTRVGAADRGLAMVFQSYALYPHMTVRQNLAFGLENTRLPRSEIAEPHRRGRPHARDRRPARPPARPALRRPAPARRDRPRHRAQPDRLPARRAPLQPRRRAPRLDARRARRACTPASAPR